MGTVQRLANGTSTINTFLELGFWRVFTETEEEWLDRGEVKHRNYRGFTVTKLRGQVRGSSTALTKIVKITNWNKCCGDFPGGPVAKTQHSQCMGSRFDPWSWTKSCITTKTQCIQINNRYICLLCVFFLKMSCGEESQFTENLNFQRKKESDN